MCAYNSYNGLPCCGNQELSDLLRKDWGFKGYIVSDCWAVRDFYEEGTHEIVPSKEEAAALAVKAGTDLNCGDSYPSLIDAVKQKLISENELDVSLERLLVARMKLGLFAPKGAVKYENIPFSVVNSKAHQLLALETARKSMVLLKNENDILPLSKDLKKVAVIGPNSNELDVLLGNYNGFPSEGITPFKGIKNKLPNSEVLFAQGCGLADGLPVLETLPSTVLFTDVTGEKNGLNAEYFSNVEFSGEPLHKRVDEKVDFTWGTTPPFEDMSYDKYSIRWSGYLKVGEAGKYALGGEAFSGFKLFINDELIIDIEDIHEPKKEYKFIDLEADKAYKITLEFRQNNTEHAMMRFLWDAPGDTLEEEALALAEKSDVVIFCMGLSPMLEGEEMIVHVEGFLGGDRLDVNLPESQTRLMKKIKALNKPMVLVLLNGSAIGINWEHDNIPAILEAWYPGQAGGTAIADVLFGDYNPSGRLPLTFYKDIKDIPAFNDYSMKGKTYRYFKGEPLYDFGFGLSYTSFSYTNLVAPEITETSKEIKVSIDVSNAGELDGEEVVQLYFTNPVEDELNTVRTLIGFERIFLKANETKNVNFTITPKQLARLNNKNKLEVPSGEIIIAIGGKQPNDQRIKDKVAVVRKIKLTGEPFLIQQ